VKEARQRNEGESGEKEHPGRRRRESPPQPGLHGRMVAQRLINRADEQIAPLTPDVPRERLHAP
jgi:hypothetical protein